MAFPRFSRAFVVENDRAAMGCTADVTGLLTRESWQMRPMAGRDGVWEMGMRKTFAREARTGERERMAVVLLLVGISRLSSVRRLSFFSAETKVWRAAVAAR